MDLNEIRVFVSVAEEESFTEAARRLEMPLSTVSSRVSSLEDRLGITLLRRTTRKVHLTDEGRLYLLRCRQGLNEIANAEAELLASQVEPRGVLRITAPSVLGSHLLPEVAGPFMDAYPAVQLEFNLTDSLVDLVGEGVDLALRAGDLEDSSLVARKLGISYFAPFASASYLEAKGMPLHPKDLADHQCLAFSPFGSDFWEFSSGRSRLKIAPKVSIVSNDMHLIRSLAIAGRGVALLPTFICAAEVASGGLQRILPEWRSNARSIHFVYPMQRFLTPKVRVFIDMSFDVLHEKLRTLEI